MGNSYLNEENMRLRDIVDKFQIIRQDHVQNIKYLEQKQTKKQYALKEIILSNKQEFKNTLDQIMIKKNIMNHPHLLEIIEFGARTSQQFCSTICKIQILYEYPDRNLDEETNERYLNKKVYNEKQLWTILASCILAMSHLQKNDVKHQSLRSSQIYIQTSGLIKIKDPFITNSLTNYQILIKKRSSLHIYLSPQLCEFLINESILEKQYDPYKSDVFTLGMIMLETGLREYQDFCYNDEGSRIDWERVRINIGKFSELYSNQLTKIISVMLEKSYRLRQSWTQLQRYVKKLDPESTISKQSKVQGRQRLTRNVQNILKTKNKMRNPSNYQEKQYLLKNNNKRQINSNQQQQINWKQSPSSINYISLAVNNPTNPNPEMKIAKVDNTYATLVQKPYSLSQINKFFETKNLRPVLNVNNYNQNQQQFRSSNNHALQNKQSFSVIYQTISDKSSQNIYSHPYENNEIKLIQNYNLSDPKSKLNVSTQKTQQSKYVVENFIQGSKYQGYKLNGMRHGKGKFFYQDGGLYDGEFFKNKMNGYGKLYYQSGTLAYEGNWKEDKFNGFGILYNEAPLQAHQPFDFTNLDSIIDYWLRYQGEFEQDLKQGNGKLFFSNNQHFQGKFNKDFANGRGKYFRSNNQYIQGIWHSNCLQYTL